MTNQYQLLCKKRENRASFLKSGMQQDAVSLLEVLTVLARAISKRKKESGYRWERKKSYLQTTQASI